MDWKPNDAPLFCALCHLHLDGMANAFSCAGLTWDNLLDAVDESLPHDAQIQAVMKLVNTIPLSPGQLHTFADYVVGIKRKEMVLSSTSMFRVLRSKVQRICEVAYADDIDSDSFLKGSRTSEYISQILRALREATGPARTFVSKVGYRVAIIGPMKSGKSTLINALTGITIAATRKGVSMTQLPTIIMHTRGQLEPMLYLPRELCYKILSLLRVVATGMTESGGTLDDDAKADIHEVLISGFRGHGPVTEMWHAIKADKLSWATEIPNEIAGEDKVQSWLERDNDIARLCVLLWAQPSLKNMFRSIITQLYADENIPTVTVEMALSRRFNLSTVAEFSVIDTPGPDEARQSAFLELRLREVLQQANAVICVTTANSMQNTAEDNIRMMVQQLDRFNVFEKSLLVFINHADKHETAKKELELRRNTAQAFFKDPDRQDCVFFTSALNGFCAVKMEKLLLSLGGDKMDVQKLRSHMLGEEPDTEEWISHWINFSYGFDGIPNVKGWPSFAGALEKNMSRWKQSRLEAPATLIFDFWAGKVGCLNLRSAVAELMPKLRKMFRACEDVLSALATKDSDIKMRIKECEAKILQLKQDGAFIRTQQQKVIAESQAVINELGEDVRKRAMELAEPSKCLDSFLKKVEAMVVQVNQTYVKKGLFDADGFYLDDLRSADAAKQPVGYDVRILFGGDQERDKHVSKFMDEIRTDLSNILDDGSCNVGRQLTKTMEALAKVHSLSPEQQQKSKPSVRSVYISKLDFQQGSETESAMTVRLTNWKRRRKLLLRLAPLVVASVGLATLPIFYITREGRMPVISREGIRRGLEEVIPIAVEKWRERVWSDFTTLKDQHFEMLNADMAQAICHEEETMKMLLAAQAQTRDRSGRFCTILKAFVAGLLLPLLELQDIDRLSQYAENAAEPDRNMVTDTERNSIMGITGKMPTLTAAMALHKSETTSNRFLEWMKTNNFAEYIGGLMALGVAELADLNEVTTEDLTTLGMTAIQQKRFQRKLMELNLG
mmetsp:Transcript_45855/g.81959  ORF Transcript_45855/g.81959 Transcript_45855/m.81959 type:complete len:1012 (-) Transcript_45855:553-3588(-)